MHLGDLYGTPFTRTVEAASYVARLDVLYGELMGSSRDCGYCDGDDGVPQIDYKDKRRVDNLERSRT
jgi:hypothetical protein